MLSVLRLLVSVLLLSPPLAAQSPSSGGESFPGRDSARRPLHLEDYYRLKSVGSPRISPDGGWVTYTVSTPVEETNGSLTETWLVRSHGGGEPVRVRRQGEDVSDPRWTEDGRLRVMQRDTAWLLDPDRLDAPAVRDERRDPEGVLSPDGRWRAVVRDVEGTSLAGPVGGGTGPSAPGSAAAVSQMSVQPPLTDFQRRHEERFRGHALDWYPFLQDGRSFPIPDPRARPQAEVFLEPVGEGGDARQLTRLGLRPSFLQPTSPSGTSWRTAARTSSW